jgi:hypothetical protein
MTAQASMLLATTKKPTKAQRYLAKTAATNAQAVDAGPKSDFVLADWIRRGHQPPQLMLTKFGMASSRIRALSVTCWDLEKERKRLEESIDQANRQRKLFADELKRLRLERDIAVTKLEERSALNLRLAIENTRLLKNNKLLADINQEAIQTLQRVQKYSSLAQ